MSLAYTVYVLRKGFLQLCQRQTTAVNWSFVSIDKGGKKKKKKANKKYEYDSDEEIDEDKGTWEHQSRTSEMDATRSTTLLFRSAGSHCGLGVTVWVQ